MLNYEKIRKSNNEKLLAIGQFRMIDNGYLIQLVNLKDVNSSINTTNDMKNALKIIENSNLQKKKFKR